MGSGSSTQKLVEEETISENVNVSDDKKLLIFERVNYSSIRRGTANDVKDADEILMIVDPRKSHQYFAEDFDLKEFLKDPLFEGKTSIIILLPSSTSSPEHLTLCEFGLIALGHYMDIVPEEKICFLRLDDYMLYGDEVIYAMLNAGKRIYPKEEMKSMLKFIEGGDESSFNKSLFDYRAWVHLGFGFKDYSEDLLVKGIDTLAKIAKAGDEVALTSIKNCPPPSGLEVQPLSASSSALSLSTYKQKPYFAVLNASTAVKYESDIGAPIQVLPSSNSDEEVTKFVENYPSGIVFLLDCTEHMITVSNNEIICPIFDFIQKYRNARPNSTLTTVLFADSYETHCTNPYLAICLHHFIEYADVTIFATHDEASSVGNFFGRTKDPNQDSALTLNQQQCPFPRLHLFTFSSAMKQPIEDRSIMFPALTVGPSNSGSGLSAEKFAADGPGRPFMFTGGIDGSIPLTERVIPGSGDKGATLIQPFQLIFKILKGVSDSWEKLIPELSLPEGETASMYAQEAFQNIQDLSMEYEQYRSCMTGEPEEEEEED